MSATEVYSTTPWRHGLRCVGENGETVAILESECICLRKPTELTDGGHEQEMRRLMSGREGNEGSVTNGEAIAALLRLLDDARGSLTSIPADVREACGVTL